MSHTTSRPSTAWDTALPMCARRQRPAKPSWWPENEPWPPPGDRRSQGRALGRRITWLVLGIVVLIVLGTIIAWHATGGLQDWRPRSQERDGPPPEAFLVIFMIGAVIFTLVRKVRRTVTSLADVIDATYRVAGGDYSVRVDLAGTGRDTAGVVSAFNTMASRLETNETQRKHLLSDIAHELRTPLAVIQGTLEGMIDGVYPADRVHLAPLLDQGRTITRLLDDLRTVATAEAGVLSLHTIEARIDELVHDVAGAFQPIASNAGIELSVHAPEPIPLSFDPVRIRQVLDNLVSNAIRHTDAGGKIELTARTWPNEVELAVRDTGRGMSQSDADRMFERFVKASDSGGSGLGLTIARNLIEAHGGTIHARSAIGEGTTVCFRLPRTRQDGRGR